MAYFFGLPNELVDIDTSYQFLTRLHTKEITANVT